MKYTDPNELISRTARILIVDYDVLRYHSFDMFRWLIRDPNYFIRVRDKNFLKSFASVGRNVMDQVALYRSTCPSISPFEMLEHVPETDHDRLMKFLDRMLKDPKAKTTHTDMSIQLGSILNNAQITLHIRRHSSDNTDHILLNTPARTPIQISRSDRLLEPHEIVSYIRTNGINMVICSSIELITTIGILLIEQGYHEPMTMMFGSYYYNYMDIDIPKESRTVMTHLNKIPVLKTFSICNELESQYQYEFGIFDSFTGITDTKRLFRRQES